jgi:hypothetical protein
VTSNVYIANRAVTKLGEARIISLTDSTKAATDIASMFDSVRDDELRAHRWNFAKARATLPALTAKPAFGFANAFQLPTDFLSLIQVGDFLVYPRMDTRGLFSIEGRQILTNLGPSLPIRYTKRVEDPNLFDVSFIEAFACRLALESCESLTQSETKYNRVANMYDFAIRRAVRANAIERPSQVIGDDTWLESRGAGSNYPRQFPPYQT